MLHGVHIPELKSVGAYQGTNHHRSYTDYNLSSPEEQENILENIAEILG